MRVQAHEPVSHGTENLYELEDVENEELEKLWFEGEFIPKAPFNALAENGANKDDLGD